MVERSDAPVGPRPEITRVGAIHPDGRGACRGSRVEIERVVPDHDRIRGLSAPVSKECVDARGIGLWERLVSTDDDLVSEKSRQARHLQRAHGVFVRVSSQDPERVLWMKGREEGEGIRCGSGAFDERALPVIHLSQEGLGIGALLAGLEDGRTGGKTEIASKGVEVVDGQGQRPIEVEDPVLALKEIAHGRRRMYRRSTATHQMGAGARVWHPQSSVRAAG